MKGLPPSSPPRFLPAITLIENLNVRCARKSCNSQRSSICQRHRQPDFGTTPRDTWIG